MRITDEEIEQAIVEAEKENVYKSIESLVKEVMRIDLKSHPINLSELVVVRQMEEMLVEINKLIDKSKDAKLKGLDKLTDILDYVKNKG